MCPFLLLLFPFGSYPVTRGVLADLRGHPATTLLSIGVYSPAEPRALFPVQVTNSICANSQSLPKAGPVRLPFWADYGFRSLNQAMLQNHYRIASVLTQ